MNENDPQIIPSPRTIHPLPFAIATILAIAGSRLLLIGDRIGWSGGVLLLAAALVAGAVAIGSPRYGAAIEGPGDLSTRLGLGLLGGVLAGLLHGGLTETVGLLGINTLLGASVDVSLSGLEWWNRAVAGAAWGTVLGLVYPLMSGSFVRRGAVFGLLPAAWQLFYVYPFRLELGIAGVDAGLGAIPLVIVGAVVCGVVGAWPVAWGSRPRPAPLSAPLVPEPGGG